MVSAYIVKISKNGREYNEDVAFYSTISKAEARLIQILKNATDSTLSLGLDPESLCLCLYQQDKVKYKIIPIAFD